MSQASQCISDPVQRRSAPRASVIEWIGRAASIVSIWRLRARQRRELRELDDAILRDVGISRAEANFGADKPFWRE
ncbi:DUF1127 domain-containing protein [Azoarcus sp. L1K30]|uniref:DUF1127 domain-containing protein n=1 Tax=Azoarcus sp. L1K30 TaxID=2820277 RepID=UPI001B83631E|nr:DUF1127 domain-containing protein [Azoarcus sp. L1K30]MBR0567430.1 DUF1127 domain-containing protein [Azoarcus sp. L1K30]